MFRGNGLRLASGDETIYREASHLLQEKLGLARSATQKKGFVRGTLGASEHVGENTDTGDACTCNYASSACLLL